MTSFDLDIRLGKSIDPEKRWTVKTNNSHAVIYEKETNKTCGHEVPINKMCSYLQNIEIGDVMCPTCNYSKHAVNLGSGLLSLFDWDCDSDDENGGHAPPATKYPYINGSKIMDMNFAKYMDSQGANEWNYGYNAEPLSSEDGKPGVGTFEQMIGAEVHYLKSEIKGKKEDDKPQEGELLAYAILLPFDDFDKNAWPKKGENQLWGYKEFVRVQIEDGNRKYELNQKPMADDQKDTTRFYYYYIHDLGIKKGYKYDFALTQDLLYSIALHKVNSELQDSTIYLTTRVQLANDEAASSGCKYFGIEPNIGPNFASIISIYQSDPKLKRRRISYNRL
jgi:hypothetical protein